MRSLALAALLALPALSRKMLAQQYDDMVEDPADPYAEDPLAEDPVAEEEEDLGADEYSVSDHDQYHNTEDNNQSPYTTNAIDTTTQNVNFRINLLKQKLGRGGHKK